MSATGDWTFLRQERIAPLPPPSARAGAFGWLRANLFAGSGNSVMTLLCVALIVWAAVAAGAFSSGRCGVERRRRSVCLASPAQPHPGACWAFVRVWFSYFVYGFYPYDQRWRVDMFFVVFDSRIVWLLRLSTPRRDLGAFYFFVVLPILSYRAAARRAADRSPRRVDLAVGRHPGHRRGRDDRHGVLAAARHSAGARAPLETAGDPDRLGGVHRIRARRAGDHRPVHGERDAAAVRPGAFRAGQAGARADRHGAVRLRLHGGSGARRARRRAARTVRGRQRVRASAIGR